MKRLPWDIRQSEIFDPLGDKYFPKQLEILQTLDASIQFKVLAGGVGASKSWTSARDVLPEIVLANLWRKQNGLPKWTEQGAETINVWLAGDNYNQPRKEWQFIYDAISQNEYLWKLCGGIVREKTSIPRDGPWYFETGLGVVVETKSWDNPESFHSEKVHIMVLAESGLLDGWTWENRILPRVVKANGICVLNGTFETSKGPWFTNFFTQGLGQGKIRSWGIASWENPFLFPLGEQDPAFEEPRRTMSRAAFYERYGAVPSKPHGIVHSTFDYKWHVGSYKFDPSLPVKLWVDPSSVGYAVLAAQIKNKKAYIIDEYYETMSGTTAKAIKWVVSRPWANNVNGGAHDKRVPEGRSIWLNGAEWREKNKTKLRGVVLAMNHVPIPAGVERVDTMLHSHIIDKDDPVREIELDGKDGEVVIDKGTPRLFIDARCQRLIWELGQGYRYPKDSATGAKRRVPNDENNDCVKATAYGLVDSFGFVERERKARRQDKVYVPFEGLRMPA